MALTTALTSNLRGANKKNNKIEININMIAMEQNFALMVPIQRVLHLGRVSRYSHSCVLHCNSLLEKIA